MPMQSMDKLKQEKISDARGGSEFCLDRPEASYDNLPIRCVGRRLPTEPLR